MKRIILILVLSLMMIRLSANVEDDFDNIRSLYDKGYYFESLDNIEILLLSNDFISRDMFYQLEQLMLRIHYVFISNDSVKNMEGYEDYFDKWFYVWENRDVHIIIKN